MTVGNHPYPLSPKPSPRLGKRGHAPILVALPMRSSYQIIRVAGWIACALWPLRHFAVKGFDIRTQSGNTRWVYCTRRGECPVGIGLLVAIKIWR